MAETTMTPISVCKCGAKLDCATGERKPKPGDYSMCCDCYEILNDAETPERTTDDSTVLAAVAAMLEARISIMRGEGLPELVAECSPEERRRFESHSVHQKGTTERVAWHAGYISAMNDTLRMINGHILKWPMSLDGIGIADYESKQSSLTGQG